MLKKSSSDIFWLTVILGGVPLYFWLYSIGTKLYLENRDNNPFGLLLFRISIIYPITYFVFAIYNLLANGEIIKSLHIGAMISTLYAIIFTAKILKSAELNRKASIVDYLGDIFLIWFFPIGIWIIQPRINKLVQ